MRMAIIRRCVRSTSASKAGVKDHRVLAKSNTLSTALRNKLRFVRWVALRAALLEQALKKALHMAAWVRNQSGRVLPELEILWPSMAISSTN